MNTLEEYKNLGNTLSHCHGFDYRMHDYPHPHNPNKHDMDYSVCTFTGFECLQTNIRAYFSPKETTGQRYIYTGGSDGSVHIYDILTGENKCYVSTGSKSVLRDVSWHPTVPLIATTSFEGTINFLDFDSHNGYKTKNIRRKKKEAGYYRRGFY
mmetsp:Transcript_40126/g.39712  ORF Transcript_40126/g.39712 Transcript_40126/m.39712 type:complete len:154 (+) Transcript_40126:696-1157(+)